EMISILSEHYTLAPGDLIFTGTPAGVGPVVQGDKISVHIDGLTDLNVEVV
ncbi:MAG: fumarylacetoacetate hydrolase family protein, partial [Rhizobiales bacterium]|nr:fumarylacetoacetate hydrolase family protein [Hyphomicrobiales bacterium]